MASTSAATKSFPLIGWRVDPTAPRCVVLAQPNPVHASCTLGRLAGLEEMEGPTHKGDHFNGSGLRVGILSFCCGYA